MAVSKITDGGEVKRVWLSEEHTKGIQDVAFSNYSTDLVASAANDGLVIVGDIRNNASVAIVIDGAHNRPDSAVWGLKGIQNEHVLMTAGDDETIKIWDLRNVKKEVARLRGHCSANGPNKKIHHPHFSTFGGAGGGGEGSKVFVSTGGQNSGAVSLYDLGVGGNVVGAGGEVGAYSRAALPAGYGDAGSIAHTTSGRACCSVDGGEIILLNIT